MKEHKEAGWPLAVSPSTLGEEKIKKNHLDYGFGFAVKLTNAPMVKARGVWTLNVNRIFLRKYVLWALARKKTRLTGNEIKFIRQSVEMTQAQFAEQFDVSNVAVHKWENCGDASPNIKWPFERELRLFSLDALDGDNEVIGALYRSLRKPARPSKGTPLSVAVFEAA